MAFLELDDDTWACFLVTFKDRDDNWRGYFSFRPRAGDVEEDEIRTADIFLESSEAEIDQKARGLGRPLLAGLLSSALHLRSQRADPSPRLGRWFRRLLSENARRLVDGVDGRRPTELAELESLYASYRLDQVAHFISLVAPDDFHDTVEELLDGRSIDFRARDRLQLAMMVVEHIEAHLPLPPFEVWAEDYMTNRDTYLLYSHTLHREGRLP